MRRAFTLIEMVLVLGILSMLALMVMPNLIGQIEERRLPASADRMRSLVSAVRSQAMFDGKRYRVRMPGDDELDYDGGHQQPLVEREDDPLGEPGVFNRVEDEWVYGETFLKGCRCIQVRLDKPTVEGLLSGFDTDEKEDEEFEAAFENEDPDFPSLVFEPDGTSPWCTFVVTSLPGDLTIDDVQEGDPAIEVILDGDTGLIWLQRPFFRAELEMLADHDWPPVLRRDFLRPELLTETEVLEIREKAIRK